ncbi:rna binding effector protein [Sesbania bispinosa]|nr:rna binding effector protein [Sesbania bispinosa]
MAGSKRVTRQRSRGGRGRGRGKAQSRIRESNPTDCGKDEKGSQSVKNQQGVDETWMKSSVEEIKDVVTTFTQFMMSNTPTFNTIQAQAGIPRLLLGTPRASSVNMRTEPESIVARQTPSSERWTKSAPHLKFSSKECSEFPSDDVTVGQKHYV